MGLDSADWEKINAGLVRLYRELEAEKHARVMLQVLNELVPADSLCLNFFEPPDKWKITSLPENFITADQLATALKYSHQSPFSSYYLATQDASWKMLTDFMPTEDFQKLDFYQLACAPLGINQLVGGMLAMVDGAAHVVVIHRTHQAFTECERDILNALHPHLVTSYLNALFVSRANRSITELKAVMETAPGAYGYFNRDGTLAWLQPRAQEWLLGFFPDETKTTGNLPQSISALVQASLQEGGGPKSLSQANPTELLNVFLSLSAMGGWILRLERKPHKSPPRFRPLPQLSPRENEVLHWMAEGKRNAEIAAILKISPRTVEKQVHSILTKFEVENRASAIVLAMELAAKLP